MFIYSICKQWLNSFLKILEITPGGGKVFLPDKIECFLLTKGEVWMRKTHGAGAAGPLIPACKGCEICLASRVEKY